MSFVVNRFFFLNLNFPFTLFSPFLFMQREIRVVLSGFRVVLAKSLNVADPILQFSTQQISFRISPPSPFCVPFSSSSVADSHSSSENVTVSSTSISNAVPVSPTFVPGSAPKRRLSSSFGSSDSSTSSSSGSHSSSSVLPEPLSSAFPHTLPARCLFLFFSTFHPCKPLSFGTFRVFL